MEYSYPLERGGALVPAALDANKLHALTFDLSYTTSCSK